MEKRINELKEKALSDIAACVDLKALAEIKVKVLGKSGELTEFMRNLKALPEAERPLAGKFVNIARGELEQAFAAMTARLEDKQLCDRLSSERIDITIDRKTRCPGTLHPQTIVRSRITDFFCSMGFMVADSPEVETDYYNFEALNIPSDHPAREVQDTFYITEKILLRSQTSCGQVRTMEQVKPPIKMLSPGRVYRADEVDATHSPVFHQIEGLVVDKGITMCDLKGILDGLARELFGESTKIRFRPSYFPFTEPSVEIDATCSQCKGAGCKVCKGTGWIEILGAGMVNRNVFKYCGIDPDVYTGFAFGMGLDRITNIIYGITDLRVVYENDIRFLKQFK